jgi:hypothetical protein
MYHRIAAFLLGCWILGSLFMMFVATENFGAVDRMLNSPENQKMFQALGRDQARVLLRDIAGQENQLFFVSWEIAQLVLGIALAVCCLVAGDRLLASVAGVLVILAAIQHFAVTPRMLSLVSRLQTPAAAGDFGKLHAVYGIVEVVKLLLAVLIALVLLPDWRARSRSRVPVEAAKYAG